jgi:hypothetical protein
MNRMNAWTSLAAMLVLALAGSACGRSPSSAADTKKAAAPAADQAVTIEQSAIPARYAAPLPTSSAAFQSWLEGNAAMPPLSHVVDNILHGNPALLARLRTAANAVPAADAVAWAEQWQEILQYGDAAAPFCAQTHAIMAEPPSTIRLAISGPFARACAKDEDLALIVRSDTPNRAVLEFYDPWSEDGVERPRPFDPRVIAAAREAIFSGDDMQARSAAFTLVSQRDPKAIAALLAMQAEIKDQSVADEVAMAFLRSDSAEGKARGAAACKRRTMDPMCQSGLADEEEKSEPQTERVAASAVKARIDQLNAMGFTKAATVNAADVDSDAAETILVEAGQAHWFDVESDQFPNEHDSLMRSLALLVSPELDEAVFEEQAPDEDESDSMPYQLFVYAGGKRYHTQAENLGDWYDIDAVLRLMNAVMEDRKSAARFTSLATEDQTMIIVAAPPAVVAKAAKDGLLKLGDAGEATRTGKEFEEQVRKTLRN